MISAHGRRATIGSDSDASAMGPGVGAGAGGPNDSAGAAGYGAATGAAGGAASGALGDAPGGVPDDAIDRTGVTTEGGGIGVTVAGRCGMNGAAEMARAGVTPGAVIGTADPGDPDDPDNGCGKLASSEIF